ncbi:hypothetical protein ACH35V_24380 [Actinomadura sp. 1N219]|uniref:hypothetical protein n=1 Tax=Actinomadura sp. 1N219 TaxID=3375152 RepID=UPI00379D4D46
MTGTYLGHTYVRLSVAPYRRAFLVRDGNQNQLRNAILAASTIWGGMRTPIMPVREDGTIDSAWIQIAEILHTDLVVDFTCDSMGNASATSPSVKLEWPIVPAAKLEDGTFWNIHPLTGLSKEQARSTEIVLPGDLNLIGLAAAGHVALPEEVAFWRQHGATVQENADLQEIFRAQVGGRTVINATVRNDSDTVLVAPIMQTAALLWVSKDEDSFTDALWFWNLRVIRPKGWRNASSVLITKDALQDSRLVAEIKESILHSSSTKPDIFLNSASIEEDGALAEIGKSIGLRRHNERKFNERIASKIDPRRDLLFRENIDPRKFWCCERSIGPASEVQMVLQHPTSDLRGKSPLEWNFAAGYGKVALNLSAPEIRGPLRPSVARMYLQNASWSNKSLRVITNAASEYNLQIKLPDPAEILATACAEKGAVYEANDKAQQIRGIVSAGGDLEIFRHTETIALILALTPDPSRELVRELKKLRAKDIVTEQEKDALVKQAALTRLTAKRLPDITSHRAFTAFSINSSEVPLLLNELIERKLVLRGWRIDCDVCSLKDFQDIRSVRHVATCVGCGSTAKYASSDNGEPALFYRLSTLLQRVSQNGGLAPLAAAALLRKEGAFVIPGVDFSVSGESRGDLDIIGWNDYQMFSGEAKSSAAGFIGQDHERDVKKSLLVGSDVHLAICLEELPKNIRQELSNACEPSGMTLRILDGPRLLAGMAQ